MKNKGMLILAALFALSLVGISMFGGAVTYVFFWTVLLIPVISYLYILCVIISLKIYQKTEGRDMVCKAPSDFYITLQNEGWFSFSSLRIIFYSSFSGISDIDDGAVYELPPHSSIQKKTKLLCRYRGEYYVGIKKIVVGDFFGIFSFTYTIKEPLSVIVVPAMVHLSELKGSELLSDSDRDNYQRKTEPDIPVREYADGDDLRFVNWKASAISQKLMVRERRGEEKSGIAIVMDPGRYQKRMEEYLPPENKVIEWVLALSFYYMENNIPTEIIYKAGEVQKLHVRDAGDFDTLYSEMSRFSFREDNDMDKLLEELYIDGGLAGYRMIIFVAQSWTHEEIEGADRINADLSPIRVYLAQDESLGDVADTVSGRFDIVRIGVDTPAEAKA
ncbi:Protein of unknown function DUF58 [Butyrivibrio sp. ob235]|uniref:DUF58 domain-containing protein n=1 Tax=unclassified Butyrivibrio TaxID=2639466 RepID=UPI0003B37DA3|nr:MULTISPECIES: DUF58 domain-containing protein [unclassified Butyrivibrio]SEL84680.1 Protein of unknown function DUF58 [Butyrivibrio sp. ob235]